MTATPPTTETTPVIHPDTRMGPVHYTVADLSRQVSFYQERLGFKLHWREGGGAGGTARAGLGGGGPDLLRLTEMPTARPARFAAGLYHTAFLYPTRLALAQVIYHIAVTRTRIEGGSNHGTHLALYLDDAEGNGIELAWDFPREVWAPLVDKMRQGRMDELMTVMRQPLDYDALLDEAEHSSTAWEGLPPDAQVGHVHLHVADLAAAERFYHGLLGFETMMLVPQMQAAFFGAGGYHHHIGANLWRGAGVPPAPADATGLRWFTLLLPSQAELDQVLARLAGAGLSPEQTPDGLLVRDPAGIGVRLAVDGAAEDTPG